MLERIAPYLATIGVHKNGTWAAQKIIECSSTDEERAIVVNNLRPFAPPLMCDSLGNYVCAGTLRFGEPFNHYVFDAMIDRMWDIAQNRFGARCMRTCLESPYTSLYQKVKKAFDRNQCLEFLAKSPLCRNEFPPVLSWILSLWPPIPMAPFFWPGWWIRRIFPVGTVCWRIDLFPILLISARISWPLWLSCAVSPYVSLPY